MAEVDAASLSAQPAVDRAASADIVLGVLSYNDAETVGEVIRAARHGLSRFSGQRAFIVNADGGSRDGTLEAARAAAGDPDLFLQIAYPVYPVHRMTPEYPGVPGKGNAVRAVFEVAGTLGARACAIVPSGVRGITPEWMDALVRPVLEGESDYVSPVHQRHKYEATVLSGIIYPLVRALYGKRIREPIGGNYAFSPKMMKHYLTESQADGEAVGTGNDLWITIQAIMNGFRLAEARLGPRILTPREPPPELSSILELVLGALFQEVGRTAAIWQRTRGSTSVPLFGAEFTGTVDQPVVDPAPLIESFRLGYQNLHEIWKTVLPPATLVELKRLASRGPDGFRMADAMWARLVYDFVLAHRMRVMDRAHLLRALTPLYLGWLASYVLQVQEAGPEAADQRIESLCIAYETQKSYLISRWRWPDRFNP
jgi:glucosylglycerate synthase